jgi:hypothetical protein
MSDRELGTKRTEKGYSYEVPGGRWFLLRCHKCGRENYGVMVSLGVCCWCGWEERGEEDEDVRAVYE